MQQSEDVSVRLYRAGDEGVFRQLNLRWIERYFQLEAHDRAMLENMDAAIFGKGGRILMTGALSAKVARLLRFENATDQ